MTSGKIVVLGTGGTIAGKSAQAGDNVGYVAGQVSVADLVRGVPSLAGVDLTIEQVAQLDSKDMEWAVWRALAARCAHWLADPATQGVVVTHGTDTLEETAWFLHCVLPAPRPLVFACAMRPADALGADGPQNLADAVAVASTTGVRGVVAVCAGRLHGAREVRKVHPYRLDAFDSGDAGPLGFVEEGRLRLTRPWPAPAGMLDGAAESAADASSHGPLALPPSLIEPALALPQPWVEIVTSHAGADGRSVRLLVDAGVQGIVVAGTGNGSVHRELEQALVDARSRGVPVVRATRCPLGRILPTRHDRLPDAADLSPVKARVSLMLKLLADAAGRAA